jgi:hypothetical protein
MKIIDYQIQIKSTSDEAVQDFFVESIPHAALMSVPRD